MKCRAIIGDVLRALVVVAIIAGAFAFLSLYYQALFESLVECCTLAPDRF